MQRILLMIIVWIMNAFYLYSQILPELTEVELLKGKVKKIETRNYNPHAKGSSKMVLEYDSLGRITSKINYYIKKNPNKEYFSYDSIGNVALCIYENNDYSHQYIYKYEYNDERRIISQIELRDGEFWGSYDSIVYNDVNLPTQYLVKHPYASTQFFIRYLNGSNNERIRYIEKKKPDSEFIDTVEEIRLYNDHGFLTNRKWKTVTHMTWNDIQNYPNSHSEEYDYVDYKYDKQDNWTERKIYLNWEEKGSKLHMKVKRKIEYY